MLSELPNDEVLYQALLKRDPAYEGFAFVGVTSTGIFCRLSCRARKPKRENAVFFSAATAALAAGFRPCKRCRPLATGVEKDALVVLLMAELEREPEKRWREEDLLALHLDPSTVRRAFKRQFGATFLAIARQRRLGKGLDRLSAGENILSAQIDASYESGSGFRAAVARHIGVAPSQARHRRFLKADWLDTPIGAMLAVADGHALHLLEFFDRKALPNELAQLKQRTGADIIMGRLPPIDQLEQELREYFIGERRRFDTPLAQHGSPFTRKVWDALQDIPFGQTSSYAALAGCIGNPAACRAVARANGANPLAILVPCHRVIGADGSLTGYGGGLWRKQWLLEHEKRACRRSSGAL